MLRTIVSTHEVDNIYLVICETDYVQKILVLLKNPEGVCPLDVYGTCKNILEFYIAETANIYAAH